MANVVAVMNGALGIVLIGGLGKRAGMGLGKNSQAFAPIHFS